MDLGILYVTWNRLEFTEVSFDQLVANTDWALVDHLCVWDDYSTDGTLDYLRANIHRVPIDDVQIRVGGYRSVVSIMNRYIEAYDTELFAKVDNDIVVPPGWLNDMASVMEDEPGLDLLGAQSGFTGVRGPDPKWGGSGDYTFEPCAHIGGVGLMRRQAFLDRPKMNADGRFGFTLWQEKHEPTIGWITPDLHLACLDQIPFEPYRSLSDRYEREGWQRPFMSNSPYPSNHYAWLWWPPAMKEHA
jgi:glycosyltransferase involved in cell wall biosynthesis